MKCIIVSGTPGTGKTTSSKKLSNLLNYKYINVNDIIKKSSLCESFDKERDCIVVDEKRLSKSLVSIIKSSKRNLLIDSHMSYFIPKKYVNLCIITKCNLKVLKKRLEKKKYSKSKVKENLESEIFDICLNEAKEAGHNILVIDTTTKIDYKELASKVKKLLH
ncbi:AAA family ATPase [Candidatus Woesearchaeota archaeon]|nr:AAA family ATPase [Candidatus Woesearchaeota archaeon]